MSNRTAILANVVNALSNEGSIERNGQVLQGIANQLGYAGVKVTVQDLRTAIDAVAEVCPSTFSNNQPVVSTHYGCWGLEYRFRPSTETYNATRACIDAVYTVTDTMDRTPSTIGLSDGKTVKIETVRPRAFAKCMGHLRIRWAKGDFSVPKAETIRKWASISA